jgi:hypothetical protein
VLLVTLTSPALAQTSSNGLSEEELAAVEQYEEENPGWEITEINIPEECQEFFGTGTDQYGDQYSTLAGGICGASGTAERAAQDSLTASQGLKRNRIIGSVTSDGRSVSLVTEPPRVAPASAPPRERKESGSEQGTDNASDASRPKKGERDEGNAPKRREGRAQANNTASEPEGPGTLEGASGADTSRETSKEIDRLPSTGGVGLLPVLLAGGCAAVCLLLHRVVKR